MTISQLIEMYLFGLFRFSAHFALATTSIMHNWNMSKEKKERNSAVRKETFT